VNGIEESDNYYRFGFVYLFYIFPSLSGCSGSVGVGMMATRVLFSFLFTKTMTEHQRIFGRKTTTSKRENADWGR
jgi:Trk-type K+ transport system membrane component